MLILGHCKSNELDRHHHGVATSIGWVRTLPQSNLSYLHPDMVSNNQRFLHVSRRTLTRKWIELVNIMIRIDIASLQEKKVGSKNL